MAPSDHDAIDCDVHPAVPSITSLLPYLGDYWRDQVTLRGIDNLDLASYPPKNPLSGRSDWRPPNAKAGSSLELMQTQALDPFGTGMAICNVLYGGQAVFNSDFAAAVCRAVNDWLVKEWLDRDPRLRASIVVPLQDPKLAVEEIERRAGDRRFVQVLLLAMAEMPLGRRHYWPIYEAAARHGLAIGIHAGGMSRFAPTYLGWPSYFIEDYTAQSQAMQGQLLSLVYEGVLGKFPSLKFVLIESGVTWLPTFLWRITNTWRALRMEVPWVDRSPDELIRSQVRFTIQPFDAPRDPDHIAGILDLLGSEDLLLFATDYPHWQFEGSDAIPPGFSADLIRRIKVDNPLATYTRLQGAP